MTSATDRYDHVQQYLGLGWPVLPLHTIRDGACTCRLRSRCPHAGKHPRTRNGLKDATTNSTKAWRWWLDWPDSNVGVRTGAESGLVVIDVDPRHGGRDGLCAAQERLGGLPAGPAASTGGGGEHLLFQHPGGHVACRINLFRGVDIKADNGYIVAPSSLHVSGVYSWRTPPSAELPALPSAWLEFLCRHPKDTPPFCAKCYTEDTEDTRGIGGLGGVPLPDQTTIGRTIVRCLPTGFGQRHRQLFELARALKALMPSATLVELKPIVRQWFAYAKRHIRTQDWATTWADFMSGWERVKYPRGAGHMVELVERAKGAIPICAYEYEDNEAVMVLVSLSKQLQLDAGAKPFFLSCRMAGELTGISHQQAARFLHMLAIDGVLTLATRYDRNAPYKAAEYRYIGD